MRINYSFFFFCKTKEQKKITNERIENKTDSDKERKRKEQKKLPKTRQRRALYE